MKLLDVPKILYGTRSVNKVRREICGPELGSGLYRDVYEMKGNSRYVVKIERDMGEAQFANASEWRNWMNYREWKWFAEYLAPCMMINETGQVLIMRRIEHPPHNEYPSVIPAPFTDTKYANFGLLDNKFVCCDYSFIPFYVIQKGKSKYKEAKWWKH